MIPFFPQGALVFFQVIIPEAFSLKIGIDAN